MAGSGGPPSAALSTAGSWWGPLERLCPPTPPQLLPSHRPSSVSPSGSRSSAAAPPPPPAEPGMEPFLRKRLAFLSFFWDKIWPAGAPRFPDPDADLELEPAAEEPSTAEPCSPPAPAQLFRALCDFTARRAEELSVSRGDRLHALREEGGCILARKLSGWPCTGLVPITYVAKVAPETLSDQP